MRIWLVTIGEPLPSDGQGDRLHRTGMLSQRLAERGHDVVWWSSTFDHVRKRHRFGTNTTLTMPNGIKLKLLHGPGYASNVSFGRILDHYVLGNLFRRTARKDTSPDIILASFPTIELCDQSAAYGKQRGIPVVLDIRDLWPDIFVDALPGSMRALGRVWIQPMVWLTRRTFRNSTGLIGSSEAYLNWGLSYANRECCGTDAVFPLGYAKNDSSALDLGISESRLRGCGVDPQKTICWFVGMFGSTYDVGPVIEAARRLEATHPNVQFVFSGDGPRRSEWEASASGLPNVVFTGWLDAAGLAYLSRIAKVGLAAYAPNAPQSLPNKIFEYLAAGVPIVASLGGECRSLLESGNCGSHYSPGDSASFLIALRPFVENEVYRAECGANALSLYEARFRADKIYCKMSEFLERLAGKERPLEPVPGCGERRSGKQEAEEARL